MAGYRRRSGEEMTGNEYEILRQFADGKEPPAIAEGLHRVALSEVEKTIARRAGGCRARAALLVAREANAAAADRENPRRGRRS